MSDNVISPILPLGNNLANVLKSIPSPGKLLSKKGLKFDGIANAIGYLCKELLTVTAGKSHFERGRVFRKP